jgi:hypothetical protein
VRPEGFDKGIYIINVGGGGKSRVTNNDTSDTPNLPGGVARSGSSAEGFVAFAPHRYSGPTAATIEEADALQRQREDRVRTEAALVASMEFLSAHEAVAGLGTDNTSGMLVPRIGAALLRS